MKSKTSVIWLTTIYPVLPPSLKECILEDGHCLQYEDKSANVNETKMTVGGLLSLWYTRSHKHETISAAESSRRKRRNGKPKQK